MNNLVLISHLKCSKNIKDLDCALRAMFANYGIALNGTGGAGLPPVVTSTFVPLTRTLTVTVDGVTTSIVIPSGDTDAQQLALAGNSLSLTNGGTAIDLAPYLVTQKYTQEIAIGDWVAGATESTLFIDKTIHLKGGDPVESVREYSGGALVKVEVASRTTNSGDLTLSVALGAEFAGRVVII